MTNPTSCFNTIGAYNQATFSAFLANNDYCAQFVMNAMIPYYNACNDRVLSFYGFNSQNVNYNSPQEFQSFCLNKYNIALNGPGLATVSAKVAPTTLATTTVATITTGLSPIPSTAGESNVANTVAPTKGPSTGTIVGIGAGVLAIVALAAWWFCASPKPMKRRHDPIQNATPLGVNGRPHQQQEPHVIYASVIVNESIGPPSPSQSNTSHGTYAPVQQPAQPPASTYGSTVAPLHGTTYAQVAEPIYAPTPSIYTQSSNSVGGVAPPVYGTADSQLSQPICANTSTMISFGTPKSDKERQAQEDAARAVREAGNDATPPEYQELPDNFR
ncbi:UNVERIFIED_CONTAM: hypothetical protein HDU68_001848 [Siphonaria sp. JEL0065]|nr:hypothetical protein HDU68_001848 [Siphonaria sp. JEL0065]